MSCNSHSPPLSQTGQSRGWLVSRNSSMRLAGLGHLRVSVLTTMPSPTGSVQAVMQLGHLLHFHQAHAAGGLQREPFVVAEGRNLDADLLGGVDDQRSGGRLDLAAVDRELDRVSHVSPLPMCTSIAVVRARACQLPDVRFELVAELLHERRWSASPRRRPSGQNVRPSMFLASSPIRSMSVRVPPPSSKRCSILRSQVVPSRQGMHQPQLSCA